MLNFFKVNPFKPHLYSVGGLWYIRKLTIFGYAYLDNVYRHWRLNRALVLYASFATEKEAVIRVNTLKPKSIVKSL